MLIILFSAANPYWFCCACFLRVLFVLVVAFPNAVFYSLIYCSVIDQGVVTLISMAKGISFAGDI